MLLNKYKFTPIALVILMCLSGCIWDPPPKKIGNSADIEIVEEIIFYKDSAIVKIKLDFPPRYFHKKAIYHFKPRIIVDSDTIELRVDKIYGEKAGSNLNIISFKYGSEYHFSDSIHIVENFNEMVIVGGGHTEMYQSTKSAPIVRNAIFKLIRH